MFATQIQEASRLEATKRRYAKAKKNYPDSIVALVDKNGNVFFCNVKKVAK